MVVTTADTKTVSPQRTW